MSDPVPLTFRLPPVPAGTASLLPWSQQVTTAINNQYSQLARALAVLSGSVADLQVAVAAAGYGGANLVLVNGANNDVIFQPGSQQFVTGPTLAFSITGFAGGTNGRRVTIINGVALTLSFKHEDAGSVAANRLRLPGSGDLKLLNMYHAVTLEYGALSRWFVVGVS